MSAEYLSFIEVLDLVYKIQIMLEATSYTYNEVDGISFWIFGFGDGKPPLALDEKTLCSFYKRLTSSTGVKQ